MHRRRQRRHPHNGGDDRNIMGCTCQWLLPPPTHHAFGPGGARRAAIPTAAVGASLSGAPGFLVGAHGWARRSRGRALHRKANGQSCGRAAIFNDVCRRGPPSNDAPRLEHMLFKQDEVGRQRPLKCLYRADRIAPSRSRRSPRRGGLGALPCGEILGRDSVLMPNPGSSRIALTTW